MAKMRRIFGIMALSAGMACAQSAPARPTTVPVDQPDAQRTKEEISNLLDHYPPALRGVLALDHSLLTNQAYLAPYPALSNYLVAHPEVSRNASFYVGDGLGRNRFGFQESEPPSVQLWRSFMDGLAIFLGFGMAIGLIVWLIRTIIDYRRWNRLAKVQTDAHTRILDRFSDNEELLAYIQSPAGARFLQSSPITLDAAPRSIGAPLGRILWSMQAGFVLAAGGFGLESASSRVSGEASQPLVVLGTLGIALGIGFVISAIASYVISWRLGLIERSRSAVAQETRID